jgi:hypothetical protein
LVFLDSDENLLQQTQKTDNEIIWKANSNPQGYIRFTVFQPFACGTGVGFDVNEMNPDNSIKTWKVMLQPEAGKSKTFIIDADRCIHLLWKKRENGWQACSRVLPMLRFCISEEMTFMKLTKRAHDLAGGILHIDGVSSKKEQTDLDADMGSDLTSVDRIYTLAGRTVEYQTPDLKAAGEFSAIFELYTKKLCRFMRINQLILDGEHTGASLGGNDNTELYSAYTEIHEIQEHYKNYLEKVFFKLGKENTCFEYREVLPQALRMQQQQMQNQPNDGNPDENKKPGDATQPPQRADSGNKQPVSNKPKSTGREQTR